MSKKIKFWSWRPSPRVALVCKSSADKSPHGSHAASPGDVKTHKSKRTSTHIPAFYFRLATEIAAQCGRARRFEQSAHDLLCEKAIKPAHAPRAARADWREKKKGLKSTLRHEVRVPPRSKTTPCVKMCCCPFCRQPCGPGSLLERASRACRGSPPTPGAPPSCPCACGWRGRAR